MMVSVCTVCVEPLNLPEGEIMPVSVTVCEIEPLSVNGPVAADVATPAE